MLSGKRQTYELRIGITAAVFGIKFFEIFRHIENQRVVGEEGPLRFDVFRDGSFPKAAFSSISRKVR